MNEKRNPVMDDAMNRVMTGTATVAETFSAMRKSGGSVIKVSQRTSLDGTVAIFVVGDKCEEVLDAIKDLEKKWDC